MDVNSVYLAGLSEPELLEVSWHPQILADPLTLIGEQIMPTTLLLAPTDF